MVFQTKIQSLAASHANNAGHTVQSAVDWNAGIQYQFSSYLSAMSINTGAELLFAPDTDYTGAFHEYPSGFDANGVYINQFFGNGLIQIDKSTFAPIQTVNADFAFPQGTLSPIIALDGSTWMLITGTGGQVFFEYFTCMKTSTTPMVLWGTGKIAFGNKYGMGCSGRSGHGLGYVAVYDLGGANIVIYEINVNTGTHATVATIVPTDIDAAWTTITLTGICLDQTDFKPIVFADGNAGANRHYIFKVNQADGSIPWKTAVVGTGGGLQTAQSQIKSQQYCLITSLGGGANQCTVIDTSSGAITTTFTTGMQGTTPFTAQCYNDQSGAVIGEFSYTNAGANSPIQLNATPASFTGWAAVYVVQPTNAPVATGTHASFFRIWGNYH